MAFDYLIPYTDEDTAIFFGSQFRVTVDGEEMWDPVRVLPGVAVTRMDDNTIPDFCLLVSSKEADDDLAALSVVELSRDLIPTAAQLTDCVLRFDSGWMEGGLKSIVPAWANYPGVPDLPPGEFIEVEPEE